MTVEKNFEDSMIPILDTDDGLLLDHDSARSFGQRLAGNYCVAKPFPHIVIDNFLPRSLLEKILKNFPENHVTKNEFNFEQDFITTHKRQVFPNSCNGFSRELFGFLNSGGILQFLEGMSCINGLIPDPYFDGAGFHEIKPGGVLGVHADFRINKRLNLQRRINMLIYLNPEWNDSWGGKLELWDRSMTEMVITIAPVLNRCVIFNTDATSFHGHPEPLACPAGQTRKSIALYFYTASDKVYEDVPGTGTNWQARPTESEGGQKLVRKLKLQELKKDWLPPVLLRKLSRIKGSLR
jgi:Rps23 Pro-64 3,4-dihydroxylase Tpa1-like proline 4-hydroxylase